MAVDKKEGRNFFLINRPAFGKQFLFNDKVVATGHSYILRAVTENCLLLTLLILSF